MPMSYLQQPMTYARCQSRQPSLQNPPRILQTQDYDFKITTHKISTPSSYVYVTPAGNYSFSIPSPWSMSYTSLWGNSTSFSAYGVQEYGTFLNPSVSVTSISQDSFIVNTTQLSAASIHAYLNCSYNFSTAPENTS